MGWVGLWVLCEHWAAICEWGCLKGRFLAGERARGAAGGDKEDLGSGALVFPHLQWAEGGQEQWHLQERSWKSKNPTKTSEGSRGERKEWSECVVSQQSAAIRAQGAPQKHKFQVLTELFLSLGSAFYSKILWLILGGNFTGNTLRKRYKECTSCKWVGVFCWADLNAPSLGSGSDELFGSAL